VLEEVTEELPAVAPAQPDAIDSSQVLAALGTVDEVYQAAVALFYLENYSHKEIAGILEVAVGTVKSRIARGIAQLRGVLLSKLSSDQANTRVGPKFQFVLGNRLARSES
jgi:RNA polymerase sigma-70 factor (ECF subfamily)